MTVSFRPRHLLIRIDAIGSVQFHPYMPAILSVSGSREYLRRPSSTDSDTESSSDSGEDVLSASSSFTEGPADTAMRIWSFAGSPLGHA